MRRLPLLLLLLAACGPEPARVRLADYDFLRLERDPLYGPRVGADTGIHWFASGWASPKGQGLWSREADAEVLLEVVGRDPELAVHFGGAPAAAEPELTLWVDDTEVLRHPLTVRRDSLRVALPAGAGPRRVRFSVSPLDRSGREPRGLRLLRLELTARLDEGERRAWEERVATPALDPRWLAAPAPTREVADPATYPDLLLLVLDTLRFDHSTPGGYSRDTTPHLASLADGGVVWTRVLADAPYTVSSVPGLLTGRSWHEHGVYGSTRVLPDEAVTLAEILGLAGYATLAVSDNPNVGVSFGTHQGFERFVQAWDHRALDAGWTPELPEELFAAELERGLPDRPVFAYVHLMPPHAPYFPTAAHDVWRPTDYAGGITGTVAEVRAFDRGERPATGPDRDRLVSLYDGAARRGDAMLGRILERFRSLDRGRELVVVVVSDHGEAFGEHGRFSHQTTPYDEMLHVPVVLHPGERFAAAAADPHALRALPDVMPMLLGSLRIPLPEGTWPRRFLEVLADPAAGREEIFVRCGRPFYGLRTPTSLTVFSLWGEQGWFDLTTDPGARTNLRAQRPGAFAEQMLRLRAFLEHDLSVGVAAEAELSPEEIERLRALGYL